MTETTTRFDAAEHLDTPEGMAAFMDAALETGDSAYITHALGVLAKAKGMTAMANETGISRDTL